MLGFGGVVGYTRWLAPSRRGETNKYKGFIIMSTKRSSYVKKYRFNELKLTLMTHWRVLA